MINYEPEERTSMKRSRYITASLLLLTLTAGCTTHEQHAEPIKNSPSSSTKDKITPELLGGAESKVRVSQSASTTVANKIKPFYYSGPVLGKQVALTFDDGPDNHFTLQIFKERGL
jgi:peptidoglycan/xylan/chitin deacetylase (PgdA/CDA1 family)